jgi:1-acyl-sn-glycerol-3-phosphate acyltransferase
MGWHAEGRLPETPKLVVVAAPHSSGWDFVVGISFMISLGVDVRFIGKKELFRGPVGWVLRRLGGISIDREQAGGVVDQVAAEFARTPAMVLGIAPEGTRRHGAEWKTGFYRIAVKAGVPIVPGFFDWSRKTVGLLPAFTPTGDIDLDLPAFRRLYRSFTRKDGLTMPMPPPA